MGLSYYIGVCILATPFLILTIPGYWRLFQKAGRKGWEALVPFYSYYVMLKISGRPTWWIVWLIVPFFNYIITIVIFLDFIKSFGKFSIRSQLAAIFLPFIYLLKWGFDDTKYLGPYASLEFTENYGQAVKRPPVIDWAVSFLCVLGALIFLRTFIFEAYVIPTPSMERTLLMGDCIIVNKLSYGPRLPMRPISFPYTNGTIPQTSIKTYSDLLTLAYHRLPGFSDIKRGDVIVFNYPMDLDKPGNLPVDKRESYIKRCTGIAGDTLSVVDAQVFINAHAIKDPEEAQIDYTCTTSGTDLNPEILNALHISIYEGTNNPTMTAAAAKTLKGYSSIKALKPNITPRGISDAASPVYPTNSIHPVGPPELMLNGRQPEYKWNVDNYGPIIVPKKGWTVKLDSMTYPLYERCIAVYENNKLEVNGNSIFINGKKANSYTFKMNYYWMMGDNLHDSDDSRFWGFVPEDHIIGKVSFIYMSNDDKGWLFGGIRWDRLFRGVSLI